MLRVEIVLLLHHVRLVNLLTLRSREAVNHVDFLLLDAADPLTIRDYIIGKLTFAHDSTQYVLFDLEKIVGVEALDVGQQKCWEIL